MRKTISASLILSALLLPAAGSAQVSDVAIEPAPVGMAAGVTGSGDGLIPFRCPIDQIRTAYQNLVNPDDALMALAIEKQTLAICRQSQEAMIRIAENEMRLRELFEPIMAPPPPPAPPEPPIAQILAPEPARNVTETLQIDLAAPIMPSDAPLEPEIEEPPAPTTDFTLGVLMRDPEGRKAILVRGEEMFTVREGEQIDEKTRMVRIDDASVTIADADGNEFVLE